ncbi:hemerythrin domain-containing protein [Thiohalomonas denitrificans]|uniref:hemerythrin domain-containing protein n=1 Tax=Thiohalomonas denitrificans TaxID=415747 RepID=UPI0026EC0D95|nr:hemerythrin domain-containing protein [Thiohalomonas denitrificans]
MFGLFKGKAKDNDTTLAGRQEYAPAPGTQIRYDPALVNSLEQDHQKLLRIYTAIKEAFDAGDYETVSARLNEFRAVLQGHLLTENVRLYIYLDRQLAGDDTNSDLIHGFRREMDGIGKDVMNFLKKYETIGVDIDIATAFIRDFEAIGKVLVDRIEREEATLYPLYLPTY